MRWRRFFQREKRGRELAQEIESYLVQETDENVARGMTQEEARRRAHRKFGNQGSVREAVYERNSVAWLEVIIQDLRYGLRQLRTHRGFSAAAILSLALGIGANTAIFTLVDQVLLRLLPVENPRQLVQIRIDGRRPGGNHGDGIHTVPYPTFIALREQNTVFSGLTGQRVEPASVSGDGPNELIPVGMVAGNYFEVLGVKPHLGRMLTPSDDGLAQGRPVVVLQYDFWRAHYQTRQDLIGESIRLNGHPFMVIGIASPGFEGTDVGSPTKVWVPVAMEKYIAPTLPHQDDPRMAWFYLFGR
jgi:hypothetical protein